MLYTGEASCCLFSSFDLKTYHASLLETWGEGGRELGPGLFGARRGRQSKTRQCFSNPTWRDAFCMFGAECDSLALSRTFCVAVLQRFWVVFRVHLHFPHSSLRLDVEPEPFSFCSKQLLFCLLPFQFMIRGLPVLYTNYRKPHVEGYKNPGFCIFVTDTTLCLLVIRNSRASMSLRCR